MLASLACGQNNGQSGSSTNHQRAMPAVTAVSDASDDDTTIAAGPPKEIVVVRRRRRPIKKRIPAGDYRPSSSSGSVPRRKSLLESSIFSLSPKANRLEPPQVEQRDEQMFALEEPSSSSSAAARAQENEDVTINENNDVNEANEDVPALVCIDEKWKHIHTPLVLPSYLPCPASALRDVNSICLTLEER